MRQRSNGMNSTEASLPSKKPLDGKVTRYYKAPFDMKLEKVYIEKGMERDIFLEKNRNGLLYIVKIDQLTVPGTTKNSILSAI